MRRELELDLGVDLTSEEIKANTGRLVEALGELDDVKEEKKEIDGQFKARREALEDLVGELAKLLRDGRTTRLVACVEELNVEKGKVQIHRTDTMEIVSERDATDEERQLDMLQGMADAGAPASVEQPEGAAS